MRYRKSLQISLVLVFCSACVAAPADDDVVVTLLFTNDMESAYDPVPAWWRDDIERIGGLAHLATLIKEIRRDEPNVFLFDSGDIFTGALSQVTDGELMFEFMITMGYDAMAIGNHEFDYNESVLEWQKSRAPFPVLGANLFYTGTKHPYAQPHAIIERGGIRIGVIGTLGQDAAATAIARDHIDELDVVSPAVAAQRSVDEIADDVDVVVLLTHQGHTAPMQTDAEADPRLDRDIDKDIALADTVTGVDVLFGGHADAGTWEPVVSPQHGTLIMQTFGQAFYLGFLQLTLDAETREIVGYNGKLVPVDAGRLEPDPVIERKYTTYRAAHPAITEVVGRAESRMNRKYFDESTIGNLMTDIMAEMTGADMALLGSGAIRADLAAGEFEISDALDISPFVDPTVVTRMTGAQLIEALEQSFTQLRGLLQVSGLELVYDLSQPEYQRAVSIKHNGREIDPDASYDVAVARFLALGGDHYDVFTETTIISEHAALGDLMIEYFRKHESVPAPALGRQTDRSAARP